MASPGNQHCVNCIGTLSFPMSVAVTRCWQGRIKTKLGMMLRQWRRVH